VGFGIIDFVALQQKREDRPGGGYSLIAWDDEFGHAVIWEYGVNDQLQRRGVVTHVDGGSPAPDGSSHTIWHDAAGCEITPT
jgi:hypothetical protein